MPCFHPISAWKAKNGVTSLREPQVAKADGAKITKLPCGRCVGCRTRQARDWAIRCDFEARQHAQSCFVTLTYAPEKLPHDGFLRKRDLSGWIMRVRSRFYDDWVRARKPGGPGASPKIRFFGCGEYGERTKRPHYHCLLFGVRHDSQVQRQWLQECWTDGFIKVDPISLPRIAYVAGYVGKKIGDPQYWPQVEKVWIRESERDLPRDKRERFQRLDDGGWVSESSGEYVTDGIRYVLRKVEDDTAPFRLMSRNPGIGGDARRFERSWRETAIWRGREVPVPRFLHLAYKQSVSDEEYAAFEEERREKWKFRDVTKRALAAGEAHAEKIVSLKAERRRQL